jgi:hypothetical protein
MRGFNSLSAVGECAKSLYAHSPIVLSLGLECLRFLREGALPVFEKPPPSGFYPNAHSAFANGSLITDTLCTYMGEKSFCVRPIA